MCWSQFENKNDTNQPRKNNMESWTKLGDTHLGPNLNNHHEGSDDLNLQQLMQQMSFHSGSKPRWTADIFHPYMLNYNLRMQP